MVRSLFLYCFSRRLSNIGANHVPQTPWAHGSSDSSFSAPLASPCVSHCNSGDPGSIPGSGWVRWRRDRLLTPVFLGFPGGSAGKESTCNVGDLGLIPGLGRSLGEGNGYPLQFSGLENSMDSISMGLQKVGYDWAILTFTFLSVTSQACLWCSSHDFSEPFHLCDYVSSVWAAITEFHRLINNINLFLTILKTKRSKIKVTACLVSDESPFPGSQMTKTSRGSSCGWGSEGVPGASLLRAWTPSWHYALILRCCPVVKLCPTLCDPRNCSLQSPSVHGIFQARVQGIFLAQGLNPGLLHCRQMLYHLSHEGSSSWPNHPLKVPLSNTITSIRFQHMDTGGTHLVCSSDLWGGGKSTKNLNILTDWVTQASHSPFLSLSFLHWGHGNLDINLGTLVVVFCVTLSKPPKLSGLYLFICKLRWLEENGLWWLL